MYESFFGFTEPPFSLNPDLNRPLFARHLSAINIGRQYHGDWFVNGHFVLRGGITGCPHQGA